MNKYRAYIFGVADGHAVKVTRWIIYWNRSPPGGTPDRAKP